MELHINVINKIATYQKRGGGIVCGNSDYTVRFTFDAEWDTIVNKKARFIWNGQFVDKDITDGVCEVPVLQDTDKVWVGVYGANGRTSTPVVIECFPSILCPDPIGSLEAMA